MITGKAIPVYEDRMFMQAEVREADASDAPVAARFDAIGEYPGSGAEEVIDLRAHDGRFYSRVPQAVFDGMTMDFGHHWANPEAVERILRNGLAGLLLIDGQLWEPTVEPALFVTPRRFQITITHSSNPHIRGWAPFTTPDCFKLTEMDGALAYARQKQGTDEVDAPFLEVLVPEAFPPRPVA